MNPIRNLPTTVATITRTAAPTSRRRRRAVAVAAMIPLVAAAAPGSAAADDPPGDRVGCAPITCAEQYIGVPANTLAAQVVERSRAGQGLGFGIVIDMLDAAEETKLASVTGPSPAINVFQVRQIMQDHDDLEVLIVMYAASSVLPQWMPR